jgi:hypothetical protein
MYETLLAQARRTTYEADLSARLVELLDRELGDEPEPIRTWTPNLRTLAERRRAK